MFQFRKGAAKQLHHNCSADIIVVNRVLQTVNSMLSQLYRYWTLYQKNHNIQLISLRWAPDLMEHRAWAIAPLYQYSCTLYSKHPPTTTNVWVGFGPLDYIPLYSASRFSLYLADSLIVSVSMSSTKSSHKFTFLQDSCSMPSIYFVEINGPFWDGAIQGAHSQQADVYSITFSGRGFMHKQVSGQQAFITNVYSVYGCW